MSDIPEIPKTEEYPLALETDVLESKDAPESLTGGLPENTEENTEEEPKTPQEETLEEGEPSNPETSEFGESRIEDIKNGVKLILKNSTDAMYLRGMLENDPVGKNPEVGGEELLEIDRINKVIIKEGEKAEKDIIKILGGETLSENEEEKDLPVKITTGESEENKNIEEIDIKEVTDWWGFTEDRSFSPETQTLIENNPDLSDLLKDFTPEEQKIFDEMYHKFFDTLPPEEKNRLLGERNLVNSILSKEAEKDSAEEFRKLMVRLAVKVSFKVAVTILKNIQKSSESKAAKVTCGTLADLLEEGGKELDKAYTGQINPEDITIVLRNHFFGEA